MSYNSKYTGQQVEDLLDQVANGNAGGGGEGGVSIELDPIFLASPAAKITDGNISAWNNKVDKVEGKQLSTEDFTTLLKQKLEGLSNYDDTEIQEAVSKLRTDLDTLVSGDTTTAIKTFNEVVAFLDGFSDTEDLSGIIASIEQQIASKQDKITDLEAIRSGAAKGATALQVEQYTGTYSKPSGGIPKTDLASAVQESLSKADTAIQTHQDISGKVDKSSLAVVATSGSYNDLSNKPTIPSAVTESTVSGWGFTKNTGTYSKPSGGIPKSDLASAVQTSLGKADTALQEHQDISGKQDKVQIVSKGTSDTTITIESNKFYIWGEVSSLDITLGTPSDSSVYNEYLFQFTSGATATTLVLPSSVKWQTEPNVEANKKYQVSIVDNIGLIVGV